MGIRALPERTPWDPLAKVLKTTDKNDPSDTRAEVLQSVVFMNLKKGPGKSSAKHTELWVAANRDRHYIRRQFALYDPDITICGKTGGHFVETALGYPKSAWNRTNEGIQFFAREPGKFIVDYRHPQPRGYAYEKLYTRLIGAIHEILQGTCDA